MGKTSDDNAMSDYAFIKKALLVVSANDDMSRDEYETLKSKGIIELVSRVLSSPAYLAMLLGAAGACMMYVLPILMDAFFPQPVGIEFPLIPPQTPEQGLFALVFYAVLAIPYVLACQVSLYHLSLRKGTRAPLFGNVFAGHMQLQECGESLQDVTADRPRLSPSRLWAVVVFVLYLLALCSFFLSDLPQQQFWFADLLGSIVAGIHLWGRLEENCKIRLGRSLGLIFLAIVIPIIVFVVSFLVTDKCPFGFRQPVPALNLLVMISLCYNLLGYSFVSFLLVIEWLSKLETVRTSCEAQGRTNSVSLEESKQLRNWMLQIDLVPTMMGVGIVVGCTVVAFAIGHGLVPEAPIPVKMEVSARVIDHDATGWGAEVHVGRGDVVEFQVRFENSGGSRLHNARLVVALPEGLEYEQGTAKVCTPEDATGRRCDDLFSNTNGEAGTNIGEYGPGEFSHVRFKAFVTDKAAPGCLSVYVSTPDGSPGVAETKDVNVFVTSLGV
jgi:hypothetical protein